VADIRQQPSPVNHSAVGPLAVRLLGRRQRRQVRLFVRTGFELAGKRMDVDVQFARGQLFVEFASFPRRPGRDRRVMMLLERLCHGPRLHPPRPAGKREGKTSNVQLRISNEGNKGTPCCACGASPIANRQMGWVRISAPHAVQSLSGSFVSIRGSTGMRWGILGRQFRGSNARRLSRPDLRSSVGQLAFGTRLVLLAAAQEVDIRLQFARGQKLMEPVLSPRRYRRRRLFGW
jgi:hypothetical protein